MIQRVIKKIGQSHELTVLKIMKPFIAALVVLLVSTEVASVIATAYNSWSYEIISGYWFCLGLELLALGIFFVVYGSHLQKLLRSTTSKNFEEKAYQVLFRVSIRKYLLIDHETNVCVGHWSPSCSPYHLYVSINWIQWT